MLVKKKVVVVLGIALLMLGFVAPAQALGTVTFLSSMTAVGVVADNNDGGSGQSQQEQVEETNVTDNQQQAEESKATSEKSSDNRKNVVIVGLFGALIISVYGLFMMTKE